jgi:hypothetical protein
LAVVVATFAPAFAWRTITGRTLGAVAQFSTGFTTGFTTATAFTRGTDFPIGGFAAFAAFATATIAATPATIATPFTALTVALVAALAITASAGLVVFFAIGGWCRCGAATEQALQPAEEATI